METEFMTTFKKEGTLFNLMKSVVLQLQPQLVWYDHELKVAYVY